MENNTVVGLLLSELSSSWLENGSLDNIEVNLRPEKSLLTLVCTQEDVNFLDKDSCLLNGLMSCVNSVMLEHAKKITTTNKIIEIILKN